MKAVVYNKYGSADNLKVVEVDKPKPKDNEILVRVKAVAINSADHRFLMADPFFLRFSTGLLRPKIKVLGSDISGEVAAVGSAVTGYRVGDRVMGSLADIGFGGLAEYVCVTEDLVTTFGDHISFETAAATPMPSIVALQALRDKGGIVPGQKVAINGASGGVGSASVQLAKHFGAHVTGICSKRNMEHAADMGADDIIDYRAQDFTSKQDAYDIILGVNGYHPIANYSRALKDNGTYVMIGGTNKQLFEAMLKGPRLSKRGSKKMMAMISKNSKSDLNAVAELMNEGVLNPVVDRVFSVDQTAEAFHYFNDGKAHGKVVIVF